MLNRMHEYLKTSDNQFGFKRGHYINANITVKRTIAVLL